ncbi:MAG TPA: hypothetical protein VGC24_01000 [Burkholderiaceae bacterium]
MGDFTNWHPGTPLGQYQSSATGAGYGATAFQLKDWNFAGQIHSWSMPSGNTNGSATYGFGGLNIAGWSSAYGSNPAVCPSFIMAVPQAYLGGSAMYVTTIMEVTDPATGNRMVFDPGAWDSRGAANGEFLFNDDNPEPDGSPAPAFGSFFGNGTNFITKTEFSSDSTTGTYDTERWFSYCVDVQKLAYLVDYLYNTPGTAFYHRYMFSNNFQNYRVTSYGVQPELAFLNANGWFSLRVHDLFLSVRY